MTSKFVFLPRLERSIKRLKKRYFHIQDDLANALKMIEVNHAIGSVIPHDYSVRKLRVSSQDMHRGKSGGFRLLYKLSAENGDDVLVYLLFIYAKTDQEDVTTEQLAFFVENIDDEDEE